MEKKPTNIQYISLSKGIDCLICLQLKKDNAIIEQINLLFMNYYVIDFKQIIK